MKEKRFNDSFWVVDETMKNYNKPYCPRCGWLMEVVSHPDSSIKSYACPKRLWRCSIAWCGITIPFD